jgi:hypothetical protein
MTRICTVLLATAVSLTAGATGAQAQEAGSVERSIFQGLLSGIGVIGEERPPIDYRERAPLVLPRGNTLPPPQEAGAARNPNWPNDPDVARARAAGLAANAPIIRDDDGRTLTNGEMRARQNGGLFGGGPVDATRDRTQTQISAPAGAAEMGVRPIWSQVGSLFGSSRENEAVPFPGEPTRRRLVEPPPGYRNASPDAPYGPVGRRPEDPQAAYNRQQSGGQDPAAGTGNRN